MSDHHDDELRDLGRELVPEDFDRHEPPPELWTSIRQQIERDDTLRDDGPVSATASGAADDANVIGSDHRRRRPGRTAGAALRIAAALLLVAAAVGVLAAVRTTTCSPRSPSPTTGCRSPRRATGRLPHRDR